MRVQDVGLAGRPDHEVLAWAAEQGRVLLTHDAATLIRHAIARLEAHDAMPGVLVAPQMAAIAAVIAAVIADVELIDEASDGEEWTGRIVYLPLR